MLCGLFFLQAAPLAFAQENDQRAEQNDLTLLDPEEIQAIVDGLIAEMDLNPDNISVGYCYTLTGETWYYNEEEWYYSASLYKVPLMMLLAEKEYNGELTQETNVNGLTLAYAEESILVYSNNDYAHWMMNYLGSDRECREMYQQFSTLPVEDYDPDFYDYSYFTSRFMTDVMQTLYYEQERFPHIIAKLKTAQPGHWMKLINEGRHTIAQKYGSYTDNFGTEFNHTSGIIYTPNPFILTVMTRNTKAPERVIATFEQRFAEFTLSLDDRIEQARQDMVTQAEEEVHRQEEEDRMAQEAEEQAQLDAAAEEQARQEAAAKEQVQRERREESAKLSLFVFGALAIVAVLGTVGAILSGVDKRREREAAALERARKQAKSK